MANRRVPYLYTKRGVFYLQKRVPADLQHRYGRPFIRKSLRTKDPKQANRLASSLVDGLEREWLDLRFGISEETPASDLLLLQREQEVLLSDACTDYCRMKGRTDDKKFRQLAERVTSHVISLSGDKALSAYTIHNAKAFRDALKARGAAPTTIKRNFAVVRSIWNLSAREHGINKPNPFANMHYGTGAEPVKRMPVPIDSIRFVQNECMKLDDDIRWLIALISDTGMRLAEAVGLRISDLHLDEDIPFVRLEEHASRPLKTAGSRRDIPLVGSALWAVQRAAAENDGPFLFPRYCSTTKCKADYASNTLNKWMKPYVPAGCVIHSFRHSLRDRLRACECPLDVRQHYASSRISFSLRTKSLNAALRTAHSVSQRLEDYWLGLRLQQMDIPAIHLVQVGTTNDTSPPIMEAVELYLSINGKDGATFKRTARRNAEYVAKAIGNKPIASFSSSEAAQFRDWCVEQGMTISTVKRVFGSVRAIVNLVMREHGIEGSNAFSGTFMPDRGDASTRQPIPTDKLITIQQRCQTTDDEPRWLVAFISDTGMRLSEATRLGRKDIVLDADIPHVIIRPKPWRRLKTKGSERTLPIVGCSLWAAKRAVEASQHYPHLFPRYCNEKGCKANSASAALNKWLQQSIGDGYVMHSFRHSMRDRLRAVNCSTEMIDQIGGWSKRSVGEGYGEGYDLHAIKNNLKKTGLFLP